MDVCTHCVWEQFSQQLKNFILKRVNDRQDAEDILQDVFLKIHLNIHSLKDEERLLPWLYQITRNTVIDHYRIRRPINSPLDEEIIPDWSPEPLAADEIANGLKDFIAELPEKYHHALMMTEFHNLSQKELADQLSISISGAKSRVQRGRALLKQNLEDCCKFEFDRYGHLIDYTPKNDNCCDDCIHPDMLNRSG